MCIASHPPFLLHDHLDASLALDRDPVGFDIRADVGYAATEAIKTVVHPVSDLATAKEVVRHG
jgi:hypothetical protein